MARGFDVADNEIAQRVQPGDLVVTADIPLAADVIERGAHGLDPRGELYTADNICEKLQMRNFMDGLRASGAQTVARPRSTRRTARDSRISWIGFCGVGRKHFGAAVREAARQGRTPSTNELAANRRKRGKSHGAERYGKVHTIEAEPDMPLPDALRDHLSMKEPRFGCGFAQCGGPETERRPAR